MKYLHFLKSIRVKSLLLCFASMFYSCSVVVAAKHAKQQSSPNDFARPVLDYMLIDEGSHIHVDFDFFPPSSRFVVITSKYLEEDLTEVQRSNIDELVVLDSVDYQNVLSAVKNNARDYTRTCLIAIDESLAPMVARVRETLGIPGPSVHEILPFCDKVESKKRLKQSTVHYPKFMPFHPTEFIANPDQYVQQIVHTLAFPLIIKPRNLAGAHGVRKVSNAQELRSWCDQYDASTLKAEYGIETSFEFEEYVDPQKSNFYHCDLILRDGGIVYTQVSRYAYPCLSVTEGKPIGSITLPKYDRQFLDLSNVAAEAIKAFSRHARIPDGVMHMEFFYNEKNRQAIFIESQLRHPGLEVCTAYKQHLGTDWEEIHWRLQIGLPVDLSPHKSLGSYVLWMYYPTENGIVASLRLPQVKGMLHKVQYRIFSGKKTYLPKALTLCDHCDRVALRLLVTHNDFRVLWDDFCRLSVFKPYTLKHESHD
jgi:D-ala D-ala ligase C-terminus